MVLVSNDVRLLHFLLQLTIDYCTKYHVTLAPEKTRLVGFSTKSQKSLLNYQKAISPITINNVPIEFSNTAEHVGVIRSTDGNLLHIQGRVTSHTRALYSVLPAGLAMNHHANPAASLRVESLCMPFQFFYQVLPLRSSPTKKLTFFTLTIENVFETFKSSQNTHLNALLCF